MQVPFVPDQIRELAERVRQALNAYDDELDRHQLRGSSRRAQTELLAQSARSLLGSLATMVGLSLDASFLPQLAAWSGWDPFYDDGGSCSDDYFQALTRVLRDASGDVLRAAVKHSLTEVRVATANALSPQRDDHAALLRRLAHDRQWPVAFAARTRLEAAAPTWHEGVLGAAPEQLVAPEQWASLQPLVAELETVFGTRPSEHQRRDALLERLLPALPDAIALPVATWRLGQAAFGECSAVVADVARRAGAAAAIVDSTLVYLAATDVPLFSLDLLGRRLAALSDSARHEACLGLLQACSRPMPPHAGEQTTEHGAEQTAERDDVVDAVSRLMEKHWASAADPSPVWAAYTNAVEGGVQVLGLSCLRTVLANSERLAAIEGPLVDSLRGDDEAFPTGGLLQAIDRLIESWPAPRRERLIDEGLASPGRSFRSWALRRRLTAWAHTKPPSECRAQMQRWLDDSNVAPLFTSDVDLAVYGACELRQRLAAGELDAPAAMVVMSAIAVLHGGVASGSPVIARRKRKGRQLQAELGAWFASDELPPTDIEWDHYRRAQFEALAKNNPELLSVLPEGPWHPADERLLRGLVQRLQNDDPGAYFFANRIHSVLRCKPDARFVDVLDTLTKAADSTPLLSFLRDEIAELSLRLTSHNPTSAGQPEALDLSTQSTSRGALASDVAPRAPARLELDWMDQEEEA